MRQWLLLYPVLLLPVSQPASAQRTVATAAAPAPSSARPPQSPDSLTGALLQIRRIYVDKLNGGETASQLRDMLISSLHKAGLFVITENPDRADAYLRGSAEDLVFTDTFSSSDNVDLRASVATGSSTSKTSSGRHTASLSVGENESTRIAERKHEASASVRLVSKDGDVIWSTTQESLGAKFRSASADVADKIMRVLVTDYDRARTKSTNQSKSEGQL